MRVCGDVTNHEPRGSGIYIPAGDKSSCSGRVGKLQAGLCWQPSAKEHLVKLPIDATLLGLALCGRLCALARRAEPDREFSLARGVAAVRVLGPGVLEALCAPWAREGCAWETLIGLARDPNLIRRRSRDVFVLNSMLADAA